MDKPARLPCVPQRFLRLDARVGKGKDILELMLTDPEMIPVWRQLRRLKKNEMDVWWERLWGEIVTLKQSSKVQPSKKALRRDFVKIGSRAAALREEIEGGIFDIPVFEFLPDFRQLEWGRRQAVAYAALSHWSSLAELLTEIEAQAKRLTIETNNVSGRISRHGYFCRGLAHFFQRTTGKVNASTVATIASVIHRLPITKKRVQTVAKGATKRLVI